MTFMNTYKYAVLYILSFFLISNMYAQGTQLLRQPSISDTKVVFVYANDLWIADRTGGDAIRLTSNEGFESNPHFSADGGKIAFSGQYGGNTDVYIIDADGGSPQRLTWHPGQDVVQGWTSDGAVMFRSPRESHPTETNSFYKVSIDGGLPSAMNVTRAAYGEQSPDGNYLAYTPITSWDPEWRNYRGGQSMPIWIQDLKTGQLRTTPQPDKERQLNPVWVGDEIYYLSERDYVNNIWSYNPKTKAEKQITRHKVFDIKNLDAHGQDIIYEQGGYLHLIENGTTTQLNISVKGDMNFARPRWETAVGNRLFNPNLSPNAKRAIFEFRGELFTVPKKAGSPRTLTHSSGVADRNPIWSPTGDKIAWFSDQSGEYEMVIADQYGSIEKTIRIPSTTFYYEPDWSPDGTKIAYTDTHYDMWYVDISSGVSKKVDTDRYAHPNRTMNPKWSPDSKYLTYAKQQDSHFKSIFIYDINNASIHQVTESLADIITPVFDQSGQYLYYLASTDYGLNSGWLDMSSYDPDLTRTLYVTILHNDGKSPIQLRSDEEEKENKNPDDKSEREKGAKNENKNIKPIDFKGIQNRVVAIEDVSGDFTALHRAPAGKVLTIKSTDSGQDAYTYDFKKQKLTEYAKDISNIVSTYDGSHVLYRQGSKWNISSLDGKPDKEKDALKIDVKIKVDPQQEYHQIFKEGWRYMRDFLYVDNVHGAPWDKVWEWYSPWINHVRHRTDLNYVIDIMSGEVAIGHSYVSGGDLPDIDRVGVGLLGADYMIDNGMYKIKKIYNGENWNPDTRAPLYIPGSSLKEGDYISSINGRQITSQDNIYEALEETANKVVRLGKKSSTTGPEEYILVKPVNNERNLRTLDWMESNRRKVDKLSNGKLAYVWVPNTSGNGFSNFNRYYFSQQDKKGVVIDERNNGGGSAADYMIDVMSREILGYFNSKTGDRRPWTMPIAAIWGPKVMIINERAGSGGDLLPYMFKAKGLGPLVGTRTWGGLVGTWGTPLFIDGGRMVAPRGGFYDVDGEWAVEGEGISPDIEVIMDPEKVLKGNDPQLEAAVEEALRLLQENTFEMKPEPPAPIRSKRPAGWDK